MTQITLENDRRLRAKYRKLLYTFKQIILEDKIVFLDKDDKPVAELLVQTSDGPLEGTYEGFYLCFRDLTGNGLGDASFIPDGNPVPKEA